MEFHFKFSKMAIHHQKSWISWARLYTQNMIWVSLVSLVWLFEYSYPYINWGYLDSGNPTFLVVLCNAIQNYWGSESPSRATDKPILLSFPQILGHLAFANTMVINFRECEILHVNIPVRVYQHMFHFLLAGPDIPLDIMAVIPITNYSQAVLYGNVSQEKWIFW